jgi:hypothetical protein
MFDSAINLCHQSGDITNLAVTLANLALFFDTDEQPDVAATIYGATTPYASTVMVVGLADGVDHLREELGDSRLDECVAAGAAMELGEAVRFARRHIDATRQRLAHRP